MSGRRVSTSEGTPAGNSAMALTLSVSVAGSSSAGTGAPTTQRERVLVLCDEGAVAGNVGTGTLQQLLRLVQIERRDRPGLEAAADQLVRLLPRFVSALRQRQPFAVERDDQPGVGDFGHQADLRAATGFLGAEVDARAPGR